MSGKGNKQKEKKQSSGKKKEVPEPYILILAGLPGSGKSTLSTELEKFGWVNFVLITSNLTVNSKGKNLPRCFGFSR
jgi:pantothenate kinase